MIHEIKIQANYASKHFRNLKPWELRKNDRNYKTGDQLRFTVIDSFNNPTGMIYSREVTYVHNGGAYGLEEGYCILTIK